MYQEGLSLTTKFLISITTLASIFVLIPYLESTLIEPSMEHIERIQKWRPTWFVNTMHACSYTGDFDPWWAFAFLYWSMSKSKNRTDWVN